MRSERTFSGDRHRIKRYSPRRDQWRIRRNPKNRRKEFDNETNTRFSSIEIVNDFLVCKIFYVLLLSPDSTANAVFKIDFPWYSDSRLLHASHHTSLIPAPLSVKTKGYWGVMWETASGHRENRSFLRRCYPVKIGVYLEFVISIENSI